MKVEVARGCVSPQGALPDPNVAMGRLNANVSTTFSLPAAPPSGQAQSNVSYFKFAPGGMAATREQFRAGRSFVNAVEITEVRDEGEQVNRVGHRPVGQLRPRTFSSKFPKENPT